VEAIPRRSLPSPVLIRASPSPALSDRSPLDRAGTAQEVSG